MSNRAQGRDSTSGAKWSSQLPPHCEDRAGGAPAHFVPFPALHAGWPAAGYRVLALAITLHKNQQCRLDADSILQPITASSPKPITDTHARTAPLQGHVFYPPTTALGACGFSWSFNSQSNTLALQHRELGSMGEGWGKRGAKSPLRPQCFCQSTQIFGHL